MKRIKWMVICLAVLTGGIAWGMEFNPNQLSDQVIRQLAQNSYVGQSNDLKDDLLRALAANPLSVIKHFEEQWQSSAYIALDAESLSTYIYYLNLYLKNSDQLEQELENRFGINGYLKCVARLNQAAILNNLTFPQSFVDKLTQTDDASELTKWATIFQGTRYEAVPKARLQKLQDARNQMLAARVGDKQSMYWAGIERQVREEFRKQNYQAILELYKNHFTGDAIAYVPTRAKENVLKFINLEILKQSADQAAQELVNLIEDKQPSSPVSGAMDVEEEVNWEEVASNGGFANLSAALNNPQMLQRLQEMGCPQAQNYVPAISSDHFNSFRIEDYSDSSDDAQFDAGPNKGKGPDKKRRADTPPAGQPELKRRKSDAAVSPGSSVSGSDIGAGVAAGGGLLFTLQENPVLVALGVACIAYACYWAYNKYAGSSDQQQKDNTQEDLKNKHA